MKTSSMLNLDWRDVGKGALIAALTGGLTVLYEAITLPDGLSLDSLKKAGVAALTGGIAYLIKNLLTPAKKIEPVQ